VAGGQEGPTQGAPADGGANRLTMTDPVACVIRVQGALSPHWSDRLGGLRITIVGRPALGAAATSELRGELRDQAALLGALTTLYNLHLPLISLACAPAAPPADRT
jgi:hypothetical protein